MIETPSNGSNPQPPTYFRPCDGLFQRISTLYALKTLGFIIKKFENEKIIKALTLHLLKHLIFYSLVILFQINVDLL